MTVFRSIPALTFAVAMVAACSGPSSRERQIAALHADSISYLRDELFEQAMQATQFVNEVNKTIAKARSMTSSPKPLQSNAELVDVNAERNEVLARLTQLVERLDAAQGRIAGLRKQLSDKDSTFAQKMAQYEAMVAEANQAAEQQRVELQAVIDGQVNRITTLSRQVDTLTGKVGHLTSELNAVYVVAGTRDELVKKGVLVPEGRKRFLLAGARPVAPARDLDPSVFTRIDRTTDSTIYLPDGVYRIVTRQNAAYATPTLVRNGAISGGLRIDDPEKFWNSSKYLILLRG